MKHYLLIPLVLFLALSSGAAPAEQFSAKTFAGPDGNLDEQQAALYIVYRDKEPLSKFMKPDQTTLDLQKVKKAMAKKLDDLRSKTHKKAPWKWEDLDKAYPPKKSTQQEEADLPAWKRIDGITKIKELPTKRATNSIGPLILRKNSDELSQDDFTKVKGATLSYSRNALKSGSGALNSEGILDYPTKWDLWQGKEGRSIELGVDAAAEWKVSQTQGDPTKDVEELTFSTPLTFYISPGASPKPNADTATSRLVLVQAKPYFQTDFGFRHEIYGVQASAEFIGNLFGQSFLRLGDYQDTGIGTLQYQARLVPKLDCSATERGGIHTTRQEGDDWCRVGGLGSFDLRLGLKTFQALDAGVSYQLLQAVSGSGGYSYLFKTHCTLWLIENVGATIEYSKGDTPISDKPVDLLSFGLEFKY
jgi:hypothetical protein